ncbi:MAG TPA: ABC transporter substrate-binding protein, partial [Dehalococcoidia bacterium]|nr:ABC transporter substrate-binding protein [Dehalococcoidia bacterium]
LMRKGSVNPRAWIAGALVFAGVAASAACTGGQPSGGATTPTAATTASKAAAPAASPAAKAASPAPAGSPAVATKSASPAASPRAAAPTGPLKEVKIGWTPAFVLFPVAVAVDIDEFAQEGLKVTLIDFQGGTEVTSAMLGKRIDIAASQAERPMIQYENGQMAKNLMHIQAAQAYAIVVRKDLNLRPGDWQALKGKRLGMTRPGSGTDLTLRALLKLNGIDPDHDVQIIGIGDAAQLVAALEARQLDGALGFEPILTQVTELTPLADFFIDLRKEGPEKLRSVAFTTLQANTEYIEANPDVVKGVMRAIARTQKKIRENPSIAVPTGKKHFSTLSDDALLKIATNEAPTYHAPITRPAMQNLLEIQKDAGILKTDVPFDEVTVGPEFQELWQLSE